MTAIFDTRLARYGPRRFDAALAATGMGWGLVTAAMIAAAHWGSHALTGWPQRLILWASAAAFALCLFEAFPRLLTAAYRLLGVEPPPLHDAPYRARSVGEFWARWNKVVGLWLRTSFHDPLARRGRPRAGLFAAFAVSGVAHAYLVLPSLGPLFAFTTALFFTTQGALMVVERRLRIRRWPRVASHAWTIGGLLLTSPLFTEPLLRIANLG
jgi:D-alanyl-lipoteichoic acid acyltransferase DltB (MBOAT superfamily)